MESSSSKKRILILGGGFAGAYTALQLQKELRGAPDIEVLLVAQENFVLFTPMLHEVAGSDAAATDVVQPLRKMLRHTNVLIGDIESIDLEKKLVNVRQTDAVHHRELTYDQLVLALGSVSNFYHTPGMEEHALTMKTLGDALAIRNRAIDALELADGEPDENLRKAMMTVVAVGAGFAGVETVGAVNDLMRSALKFYNNLSEDILRIVLVDAGKMILPELGEGLGRYSETQLSRRGVEIHLNTAVKSYDGTEVILGDGTRIATKIIIWTAGITPVPILANLACSQSRGHIVANEYLQVPGWPGLWTLGDCAQVPDLTNPGKFCPPTAQHATRQAPIVAKNIVAAIRGQALKPFKFKTLGLLATIGSHTGVAEIMGFHFSGLIAWAMWRAIYLSKLPGLQKKVRVALDWTLDLFFSKDIVQLRALPSPSQLGVGHRSAALANEKPSPSSEPREKIA
jgi:NADH:ubiquinone reductase (H+-translocating)